MADPRLACSPPAPPPVRPGLNDQPSRFILLEREVEREFRPQILERLQQKVDAVAEEARAVSPLCPHCARPMGYNDTHPVSWLARWGSLGASVTRYRCRRCKRERQPLLDLLGVEPGRICGSLARWLALLAAVSPDELAARLANLLLGVNLNALAVWRVAQRVGQAAASYSDALSQYHTDSRSQGASVENAPPAVGLGVDGCVLGMQVRMQRRRRVGEQSLPALPPVEKDRSERSRRAYFYCHRSAWRLRPDGVRWSGDSWLLAWGMPTRCSGVYMGNSGNWAGEGPTPRW
jgi:hypothetical protein